MVDGVYVIPVTIAYTLLTSQATVPTLAQAAGQMVLFTRLSETARAGIRYEPGGEKLKDIPAPYASQDNYNMGCVEEALPCLRFDIE